MSDTCIEVLKALGAFDYAAANKLSSRMMRIYQPLSNLLIKLTNHESLYTQLSFMKTKWFTRKETFLGSLYEYLGDDLAREIPNLDANVSFSRTFDKAAMISIMTGLLGLCRLRQQLIGVYQSIASPSSKSTSSIVEELEMLLLQCNETSITQRLDFLGTGVEKEIRILTSLLKARVAITDYAFQDACIALFVCKQDLKEWKASCLTQEFSEKTPTSEEDTKNITSWRFLFGSVDSKSQKQGEVWPHTVRWYTKYHDNLTAKMTLYFHTILLAKESMVGEEEPEKSLWKGMAIDYNEQFGALRRRFGALSVSLVYEVTPSVPFYPQGYVCSGTPYEPPQGIHSFPFIFCHPNQPPKDHLPSIISIIQGSRNRLNLVKTTPVHFFDSKIGSTYFLGHMTPDTAGFAASMNTITLSLRGTLVTDQLTRMD